MLRHAICRNNGSLSLLDTLCSLGHWPAGGSNAVRAATAAATTAASSPPRTHQRRRHCERRQQQQQHGALIHAAFPSLLRAAAAPALAAAAAAAAAAPQNAMMPRHGAAPAAAQQQRRGHATDDGPHATGPPAMPEAEYHALADALLDDLSEALEGLVDDLGDRLEGADVEHASGVLTVKLGRHGTYVLNKQAPNRQVWLSSPVSGPSRFDPAGNGRWVYARGGGRELRRLLADELRALVGAAPEALLLAAGSGGGGSGGSGDRH